MLYACIYFLLLLFLIKKYKYHLHKHKAAKRRTEISGGSQSGKNGLAAYCANVNAMIACKKE